MDVGASEGDIGGFLGAVGASHPDVAIIDIRLPPTFTDEGLRAADQLRTRHPGTAVLVLSQYLDAGYALRLLESFSSGVGYLLKDRVSQVAVLIDAVERVVAGECVVDPSIVARLVSGPVKVRGERGSYAGQPGLPFERVLSVRRGGAGARAGALSQRLAGRCRAGCRFR